MLKTSNQSQIPLHIIDNQCSPIQPYLYEIGYIIIFPLASVKSSQACLQIVMGVFCPAKNMRNVWSRGYFQQTRMSRIMQRHIAVTNELEIPVLF